MEEDWGSISNSLNRPTFSLFNRVSPEEAARKESFVDIIVYNRWSKAERRLYQQLKAKYILKQIEQDELNSIDDITKSLDQLTIIKNKADQIDPQIDNLIDTLNNMRLRRDKNIKKPM